LRLGLRREVAVRAGADEFDVLGELGVVPDLDDHGDVVTSDDFLVVDGDGHVLHVRPPPFEGDFGGLAGGDFDLRGPPELVAVAVHLEDVGALLDVFPADAAIAVGRSVVKGLVVGVVQHDGCSTDRRAVLVRNRHVNITRLWENFEAGFPGVGQLWPHRVVGNVALDARRETVPAGLFGRERELEGSRFVTGYRSWTGSGRELGLGNPAQELDVLGELRVVPNLDDHGDAVTDEDLVFAFVWGDVDGLHVRLAAIDRFRGSVARRHASPDGSPILVLLVGLDEVPTGL